MSSQNKKTICWKSIWNAQYPDTGLEYLLLDELHAESVIICMDNDGVPVKISYRLTWSENWELISASIENTKSGQTRRINLRTDGKGCWKNADGEILQDIHGCIDIDIWPTPFTNSFPLRRCPLNIGERKEFRMAWIDAMTMSIKPLPQRYTRLSNKVFLYESLGESDFKAELEVDDEMMVIDYAGIFQRIA